MMRYITEDFTLTGSVLVFVKQAHKKETKKNTLELPFSCFLSF